MPYDPSQQGKGRLDPGRYGNPPSGRIAGGYAGPQDPSGQSRRKQRRDDILLRGDDPFYYPGAAGERGAELNYPLGTRAGSWPDAWGVLAGGLQGGDDLSTILAQLAGTVRTDTDIERFMQGASPFLAGAITNEQSYRDVQNWQGRVDDWAQQYGGAPNIMGQYGGVADQIGQAGAQAQNVGQNQLAQAGLGRSGQMAALASQIAQQTGSQQAQAYGQMSTQQSMQDAQHRRGFANQYLQARNAGALNALDASRMVHQMALGYNAQPRTWVETGGDDSAFYQGLGQGTGQGVGAIIAA